MLFSYFCTILNMARRLSKRKISGWLLLFAVIIFFRCGGRQKMASLLSSCDKPQAADSAKAVVVNIDPALVHRLDSFVENRRCIGTLGVCVWDETAGKPVYEYHADSLMSPASNMKMLTCVTALRRLGPNYRFRSGAYMSGSLSKDTLTGDVGLKFDHDPWFTTDSLSHLVGMLAKTGVKAVRGKVYVDAAITEPIQHEEHWTMGDLKVRKYGILHRGNRRLVSEIKYALRSKGIHVADSQIVETTLPNGMKRVGEITTPMLSPVMRALLNSSNEAAESLYYPLAGLFLKDNDFRGAGNMVVRRFLKKELHVNPDSVAVIHDGCGLCIHDKVTPRLLVCLFHYSYAHKYIYNVLRAYLPISGETGTLHRRMTKPEVKGRIQAKTGTLTRENGLTSLAGYAYTKNGHMLTFAIIQNGLPVADARLWQDKFCREMVK